MPLGSALGMLYSMLRQLYYIQQNGVSYVCLRCNDARILYYILSYFGAEKPVVTEAGIFLFYFDAKEQL